MVALAAAGVIAVVVAKLAFGVPDLPFGDSGEDERQPPALTESTTRAEDGVTVGWPETWSTRESKYTISLTSEDRTATVVVSAPAIARGPRNPRTSARVRKILLDDAVKAIRRRYKEVRVRRAPDRRIDRYEARQAVLTAVNRNGVPLRILVAAARGKRLAYLVESFAAANAPARRLVEAQTILASLRLSG
jgi:hypothetical protein